MHTLYGFVTFNYSAEIKSATRGAGFKLLLCGAFAKSTAVRRIATLDTIPVFV